MKKIIVINGSGTSGKDTLIEIMVSILNKNIIIKNISTIDPIKKIAKNIGWNEKKDNKVRRLLSDLKDAMTRYNNFSFNYVKNEIDMLKESLEYLIFVHVRESKEIEKIVEYYDDIVTLLIRRPNNKNFDNHADEDVENYCYDYIIENNGTLDNLKESIVCFLEDIEMI